MDISLFTRGIHLSRQALAGKVQEVAPPALVELVLQQGVEAACQPVVDIGDTVLVGQTVAESVDGGADLHAPISGRVKGFKKLLCPDGVERRALLIEASGPEAWAPFEADPEPLKRSATELIERIRRAGVLQSGADALSLARVLREALDPHGYLAALGASIHKPVRDLAIRLVDVDPHLVTIETTVAGLGANLADFTLGVEVLLHITGASHVHLVLDKAQRLPAIEALAAAREWNLLRLKAGNYPSMADYLVVRSVTGREPEVTFQRAHQSGTLVVDADTLLHVVTAVRERRPVVERTLTVSGPAGTHVVRARIGTSLTGIVKAVGESEAVGKAVLGGPMRGMAHLTLAYPLDKAQQGLMLYPPGEFATSTNDPCVSCGLCVMVCPMRLMPGLLSRQCEYGRWEMAEEAHIFNCVECGCCAYVCPAGRSMVQLIVHGKKEILAVRRSA